MGVSDEYLGYIVDQLASLGAVTARRMFGGAGLYLRGDFFAIVADDTLYFKVDDSNRGDYEAAEMGPFRPFGTRSYAMQYYEVPAEVLEDPDQLRKWAQKAVAVARAKPKRPATKGARPRKRCGRRKGGRS